MHAGQQQLSLFVKTPYYEEKKFYNIDTWLKLQPKIIIKSCLNTPNKLYKINMSKQFFLNLFNLWMENHSNKQPFSLSRQLPL